MNPQYRKFKIEKLDTISPTFCAAKWLTTDIYLHTGVTSSCQLPEPGPIDFDMIQTNVLAVHNTQEKIDQRRQMLQGMQPSKCSSCWDIENQNSDAVSHRIATSYLYRDQDFTALDLSDTVVPKMITIMFDNLCNFVCSYCDPTQSTSWSTDLIQNGPYIKIKNDPKKTYQRLGKKDRLNEIQKTQLLESTKQMIVQNLSQIHYLRFLGGEPTINPGFWDFLDMLQDHDVRHIEIQIVTNLSYLDRLMKFLHNRNQFASVKIIASIDGTDRKAEFTRKGLKWNQFEENVSHILDQTDIPIAFIGTINILSLDGFTDLLSWVRKIQNQYPGRVNYDAFLVKWPNFQSINILPEHIKNFYSSDIMEWKIQNEINEHDPLSSPIDRLLTALDKDILPDENLQKDFRYFVHEFARRNNLSITDTFSKLLVNFIQDQ